MIRNKSDLVKKICTISLLSVSLGFTGYNAIEYVVTDKEISDYENAHGRGKTIQAVEKLISDQGKVRQILYFGQVKAAKEYLDRVDN